MRDPRKPRDCNDRIFVGKLYKKNGRAPGNLLLLYEYNFKSSITILPFRPARKYFFYLQSTKTPFTWSGGPRLSGVGFYLFCVRSLRAWKQKKSTPLDRGPPLHVNMPLEDLPGDWCLRKRKVLPYPLLFLLGPFYGDILEMSFQKKNSTKPAWSQTVTGFVQKIPTIFQSLFKDFSRTKWILKDHLLRNTISSQSYKNAHSQSILIRL